MFDEVVKVLHEDYAGCFDKDGFDNPDYYLKEIKLIDEQETTSDDKFVALVQDYLLDFKDLHMSFRYTGSTNNNNSDVGFTVRRYKELLYVVSNCEEDRVKPGFAIAALDEKVIPELVELHKRKLMETEAERENWSSILPLYKTMQVVDDKGKMYTIQLKKYEKETFQPEYSLKEITDDTLLLKLTDFMDHDAISKLINKNDFLLKSRENLIIDVRINKGGSDLAYFELLPYIFEGEEIDLDSFDEGTMLTNCTSRNVELRVKLLKDAASSIEDTGTRNQLNSFIQALEDNKGKDFVELDLGEMEESLVLKTKPGPQKNILLTDVYCGSSGDSFVEICKNSSKVTVVGRPTLGLNDYANLAIMDWENKFQFWYPTSKLSKVDVGKGMSGIGIKPDIYIPWTPNHVKEDSDMKKALELLGL